MNIYRGESLMYKSCRNVYNKTTRELYEFSTAYVCIKQEIPKETLDFVKKHYLQHTVPHYRA